MRASQGDRSRVRWRGRRRRPLILAAVLLPGLYVLLIVAAAYGFLHPRRFPITGTPLTRGLTFEDITFFSETDHLRLNGWYMPADGKPRGIILFCHGREGNRSSVLPHAAYLYRAGFSVLSFDFRACGDSDGDMSTIGGREVGDALGAVRYLHARPDTSKLAIGIFGTSMGAAVAIQAAAKSDEISAVVADSPFASLDRAVYQRFLGVLGPGCVVWSVPVQLVGEWMMGATAASVSPLNDVAQIAPRPILLIHGTDDRICSVEDSRLLFAAALEPKQLWIVDGAGHMGAFPMHRDEYRDRVTAFFLAALARNRKPH